MHQSGIGISFKAAVRANENCVRLGGDGRVFLGSCECSEQNKYQQSGREFHGVSPWEFIRLTSWLCQQGSMESDSRPGAVPVTVELCSIWTAEGGCPYVLL